LLGHNIKEHGNGIGCHQHGGAGSKKDYVALRFNGGIFEVVLI